jgi:DNA-binding CsgD family transcriptional regulator
VAGEDRERARWRAALARVEWRVNPSLAMRHIPDLSASIRMNLLDYKQALPPINWLAWFGQTDQALELMEHLERQTITDSMDAQRMRSARFWLSVVHPPRERRAIQSSRDAVISENNSTALTLDPLLHGVQLLTRALADGADGGIVAQTEKILHASNIHERTLQLVVALMVLVFGEWLDVARFWCDAFMREVEIKGGPTLNAIYTAIRAEIAAREGQMALAERYAVRALELIPPSSWGVAIAIPLATLVHACAALGRYPAAAAHLRTPVPEALFGSVLGVHYLRARGFYFQSIGHHSAALLDFRSCGELLAERYIDAPAFIPWRSDAAISCLHLGKWDEARRLAQEQVALARPAQHRTYGISLRVLAACDPERRRLALLEQAVTMLRSCGDRLELARGLVDLATACRRAGQPVEATAAEREAVSMCAECSDPVPQPTVPEGVFSAAQDPASRNGAGDPDIATAVEELSEAEQRVARLAAEGHSNRQIAALLSLTVSTVEQHLTRSYRKLRISRRNELHSVLR